jgi:hypothetical protein
MEPEGSLPHSQVPVTCPNPEPARSSPYPTSHFLKIHLNIIIPSTPGSPKWSRTKSHVPFSLLRSCQSINPEPRQVLMFRNKASFYSEEFSTPRQNPKWRITPCRLSATTYSVYSLLPSALEAVPPSTT